MSIQLFAASFLFPAGLHAYPIQTNYSATTTSNNCKTTAATTAALITSQDQIWKWSATGLAIYLPLTMICFFCMIWLREKQQRGPLKEKTEKTQRSSRSERLLEQENGELMSSVGEEPTELEKLLAAMPCPLLNPDEPSSLDEPSHPDESLRPDESSSPDETLPSNDVVKQMQTATGSKRKPTKFFIDEDLTQELSTSLRDAPEMDRVDTAHDERSETSIYRVPMPSHPIQVEEPPSSFSGTETVPRSETISGTQRSTESKSKRSERNSRRIRTRTTASSSATSSTLTPSRSSSSSPRSRSTTSYPESRSGSSTSGTPVGEDEQRKATDVR